MRTSSTGWIVSASRTDSGRSSRSGSFLAGMMTVGDAGPVGGQQLLLDASDGQHLALQGDLAGHGDVGLHRAAAEQAGQRGRHGDAGRRAVLGHRPGGEVHVEAAVERLAVDAERLAVGPDERQGDLARLASSRRPAGRSGSAPARRPSTVASTNSTSPPAPVTARPFDDARRRLAVGLVAGEAGGRPQAPGVVSGRPTIGDRCRPRPGGDAGGGLAQHLAELALEVPHAGLTGVVGDQRSAARRR